MDLAQDIGIQIPTILIPRASIAYDKWAVIACDQFTSEPHYWQAVSDFVGDAPSTLHLILPEIYLNSPDTSARIASTHLKMETYLQSGLFRSVTDFVYVLRTVGGHTRRGLLVCVDLEQYDYHNGAETLIRATEGTILDRLPPRIRVRKDALLETPHILVLFDDPTDTVFGPLDEQLMGFEELYDFDLMLNSGHLTGLAIKDQTVRETIIQSLADLVNVDVFAEKYNLIPNRYRPLLFAVGDGNHSLATAKAIWDEMKASVEPDHPARYALVEIENIHDPALVFEPIHRLIFDLHKDILEEMSAHWQKRLTVRALNSAEELRAVVDAAEEPYHQIGFVSPAGFQILEIHNPEENLAVGTLQKFLDEFLENGGADRIDYVHGVDVLLAQGQQQGNAGFYLPGMDKSDLFRTVILDGALPRKTFSMGEAIEKRFYLECRKIK